jgi:hypothetical protein
MAAQHRIGGQAEHPIDPVGPAPVEDFRAGIMAVGAQQDLDPGPSRADRADQAAQGAADLAPARALARPQQRGHEAAFAVEDNDRLETVIIVIGVEQPQLLAAMHPIESVVDIQHDALWHLPERGAVLLDQPPSQAQERPNIRQVFQPRDGRLRAQLVTRGQPVQRQLEHRVAAQRLGIVAVLVAGGDHQHTEANDFGQPMLNPLRRAWVLETRRQPISHADAALDLAQGQ